MRFYLNNPKSNQEKNNNNKKKISFGLKRKIKWESHIVWPWLSTFWIGTNDSICLAEKWKKNMKYILFYERFSKKSQQ